jgi:shikimate kinase
MRPLFQDEDRFRQLYESRRQAYMRADIRIQTAGLTVDEVADAVIQRLNLAARAIDE